MQPTQQFKNGINAQCLVKYPRKSNNAQVIVTPIAKVNMLSAMNTMPLILKSGLEFGAHEVIQFAHAGQSQDRV